MRNEEFAKRAKEIASEYVTTTIRNTRGEKLTAEMRAEYAEEHKRSNKGHKLEVYGDETYAFDDSGLITAILTGWNGQRYGHKKQAEGLPNNITKYTREDYINACTDKDLVFDFLEPGELLWGPGIVGIYVGDGMSITSTEIWYDGVQMIGVAGFTDKDILTVKWTHHGKLPWLDYKCKKKTYVKIAEEVIEGKWGLSRTQIMQRLKDKGYNAGLVMAAVDKKFEWCREKNQKQIAAGVIIGKWGATPREQNIKLTIAGYNPTAIRVLMKKIQEGTI